MDTTLRLIGAVRTGFKTRSECPKQGLEGAPDAWLELQERYAAALERLAVGDDVIVLTWLHQARREVLQVYPRGNRENPLHGVFATRSPDRPNPIGLHPVRILEIQGTRLRVHPMEVVDGTPIVDIKPVIC